MLQQPQFTPEAIQSELAKILASRTFRSAASQREFLRYAVEEVIAGRGDLIKEYMIATAALGRDESFDPRLDPIVRTQARKLRTRLAKYYEGEGQGDPVRIELPKGSYAPCFHAAEEKSTSPENAVETTRVENLLEAPFLLRHRILKIALVILALAASGSAFYVFRSNVWRLGGRTEPLSIAVMPFANIGDNQENEFLSDGLTEELIDSLAQVPGLQVVARGSAFRFKGKAFSVREIGQKLNARTVLVGSARRTGNRLAVTAQLNSAADGYHLWSGSYDRDSSDIRTIPVEISRAVTNALGAGLTIQLAKSFPQRASPSPGAYQNYLKGLYFWNKFTTDSLKTAIRYLEQAIVEDPSFARAYTALADSYVVAPQVANAPPPEVVAKIRAAASKALELDSALGEAHIDLAICAEYEFDWKTAGQEFQKGLALSPGKAVAHLWYGKYLALTGHKEEVLAQRMIAAELDPVSPYTIQSVAGYLSVSGRYDEAIEGFRGALALEPNFGLAHQGLGIAYLLKGMPAEAIEELQIANKMMSGPGRLGLLGYVYAVSGRTRDARRILDSMIAESRREPAPALPIAQIHLGLGDKDRAFEWLEKAIDQRDLNLSLQWDSLYDPIRSDRRYADLLRRMRFL